MFDKKRNRIEINGKLNNTLNNNINLFGGNYSDGNGTRMINTLPSPRGSYGLLEHLKAWCAIEPEYEVLFSALRIDMEYYSEMLDSVILSYGNYSRHDSSHSKAIIRYIEQLLGEDQIAMLSATDTWLILETAYAHDIGMALSEEDIHSVWNSNEFKEFLVKRIDSSNTEDRNLASLFFDVGSHNCKPFCSVLKHIEEESKSPGISALKIGSMIRDLIVQYARSLHAAKSGNKIEKTRWLDKATHNGIQNRLYKFVAECVAAHGLDRCAVIKEKANDIPIISNGFLADYVHPRFATMLLRMGDLFDIDNNRFNEYVLAAYGELPSSSLAHKDKHRCITHLFISPFEIEICSDLTRLITDDSEETRRHLIETYKATHSWFSYISDEIDFWHSHGHEFIPEGFFYPIPILKKRDIIIKGKNYDKDNLLERFRITYDRASQIIGSEVSYREPLAFIRELVQNAFDAYKFRIYYKHSHRLKALYVKDEPISDAVVSALYGEICKELSQAEINLHIVFDVYPNSNKKRVRFAICDNGEGIGRKAYKRMRSVGERGRRIVERAMIPGWIKPTGEFGIGIHSVFKYTDKLNYRTYCQSEMDKLQIELTRNDGGNTVILPDDVKPIEDRNECGTDAWFDVDRELLEKNLYGVSSPQIDSESIADRLMHEIHKVLAPNVASINISVMYSENSPVCDRDLLKKQSNYSNISSILPDMEYSHLFMHNEYGCCIGKKDNDNELYRIITINRKEIFNGDANNICLEIDFNSSAESFKVSHKGSWINSGGEMESFSISGLTARVHLLGRSAATTVIVSREALLPTAIPEIKRDIKRAFRQLLVYLAQENRIDELPNNNTVLLALAKHYIALADSNEDGETKRLAGSAIEAINRRLSDYEIDGYTFSCSEHGAELSLEKTWLESQSLVDGDPTKHFFIRTNGLFNGIVGMHPKVLACGLLQSCDLYGDIWEEFDIDLGVSEFYALRTDTANSVIKYRLGSKHIPAESNSTSLGILLREWLKQDNRPDGMLFIPALKLKDDPNNSIFKLAVKECDFLSDNEWKLFRAFIKMPSLTSAKRYDNRQAEDKKARPLAYSNITDICPEYLDSLVDHTLENQIEESRYDKETIRQCYMTLLEMLSEIQNQNRN